MVDNVKPTPETPMETILAKLRSLTWLSSLLRDGGLSSTRVVFLGAFGVASLVLLELFSAIVWTYIRHQTADAGICVLAAGALGTFLGFATGAKKNQTNAANPTDPSSTLPTLQAEGATPQDRAVNVLLALFLVMSVLFGIAALVWLVGHR